MEESPGREGARKELPLGMSHREEGWGTGLREETEARRLMEDLLSISSCFPCGFIWKS